MDKDAEIKRLKDELEKWKRMAKAWGKQNNSFFSDDSSERYNVALKERNEAYLALGELLEE